MAGTCRAFVAAVAAVAALTLPAACSLGEKQEQADRIIEAVTALAGQPPHSGEARVSFRFDAAGLASESGTSLPSAAAAGEDRGPAAATFALVLDPRAERAEVRFSPATEPIIIFAGSTVYARRTGAGSSRPWAALDFDDLGRVETPSLEDALSGAAQAAVGLLDPNAVVGLVAGTLTGSIEEGAEESLGERTARRYDVNVSVDKSDSELDLSEAERDVRRRMLRLVGTTDDVLPASVWLDGEARLLQVEVHLPFKPAPRVEVTTVYRVRLDGGAASPKVPAGRTVVAVDSPAELARGLTAGLTAGTSTGSSEPGN